MPKIQEYRFDLTYFKWTVDYVRGTISSAAGRDLKRNTKLQLETYFHFLSENAIRVAGTRVGIETIIDDYGQGASPEEIVLRYPTLSLEQVHATITYYLANREQLDRYIARVRAQQEEAWAAQQHHPSPFVRELRKRLAEPERATSDRCTTDVIFLGRLTSESR